MKLADFDVMLPQGCNRISGLLKFNREVARVVVDAQMLVQARVILMLGAKTIEEMDHLTTAFQETKWFRLKPKMKCAPGLSAYSRHVLDAMPQIPPDFSRFG